MWERIGEGRCAQILRVGPYDQEIKNIIAMPE